MRCRQTVLFVVLWCGWGLVLSASATDRVFRVPGTHPAGLEFDGRHLWLADHMGLEIVRIDPADGRVMSTLPAPGFAPRGLAWDGELLWCSDAEAGWIYGIDVKTGVSRRILESNAKKPGALAFDGSFLWLVDHGSRRILKINRRDGMMHENIPVPADSLRGLSHDGAYLWTCDPDENLLYRLDPTDGQVVTFIPAPGPCPHGLCWDGKTLWNVDYQTLKMVRLDLGGSGMSRRSDPRVIDWEIVQVFRNNGPGVVEDLEVFIAVPETLPNQEMMGDPVFDPAPAAFVSDRWGQRFARFLFARLEAGERVKATLRVRSRHYLSEIFVFPERVQGLDRIPDSLDPFLADGFKYDLKHPLIRSAVDEAVGGETRPYWIMRRIFRFIDDRIEYNLKPLGGWNPAPTVLRRGTGSCSEYTFLFIAMCRAAGLPARYAGSVVVRGPDRGFDDVWHRWAEVYLPGYGWVPVDVQAADNKEPARAARCIGTVGNRFLITTRGGGDSRYLDSYYNFNARWKTRGRAQVVSRQYAEYVPVEAKDPSS